MLSPVRNGPGLFWKINHHHHLHQKTLSGSSSSLGGGNQQQLAGYPNHSSALKRVSTTSGAEAEVQQQQQPQKTPTTAYEPDFAYDYENLEDGSNDDSSGIPQTDALPHVNIGPSYQARIPACHRYSSRPAKEDLLWSPETILNSSSGGSSFPSAAAEKDLALYLKIARSMCLPGGGGDNREYAFHLLHQSGGDVLQALERLLNPKRPTSKEDKSENLLADYHYAGK